MAVGTGGGAGGSAGGGWAIAPPPYFANQINLKFKNSDI